MNYSKNLDKDYIQKKISAVQNISCEYEDKLKLQIIGNSYPILTSEAMENAIADNESNPLKSKFIHFCYKHKEFIRKIPFVGEKALKYKNEKYSKAIGSPLLDIRESVSKPYFIAIPELYRILLGRLPDESGLNFFSACAREGASIGAIAYMIYISKEFAGRAKLYMVQEYKTQYKSFRKKHWIMRLPLIGLYYQRQNAALLKTLEETNQYTQEKLEALNTLVHQKMQTDQSQIFPKLEQLQANVIYAVINELTVVKEDIYNKLEEDKKAQEEELYKAKEEQHNEFTRIKDDFYNELIKIRKEYYGELAKVKAEYYNELTKIKDKYCNDYTIITDNIRQFGERVHKINEDGTLMLNIATSISQKVDGIPAFVAENSKANRTSVTSSPDTVIAINTGEFIMGIPGSEWGLAMFLSLNGTFEKGSEMVFMSVIQSGMTVVDIGANLGLYTLRALRAGCIVHSFEASPEIYQLLNKNIKANGFAESGKIHSYNKAVADKEGYAPFYIEKEMCGHSNLYSAETDDSSTINVETVALDHFLKNIDKIDVVKIDVEGAEYAVLKGMENLIKSNPQVKILIEFAPCNIERAGISPKELLYLIRSFGFKYYLIHNDTGELSSILDEELLQCYSENLLLTKNDL